MPKTFPLLLAALVITAQVLADDDPFLWLEDIEGEKAMAWVEAQNRRSTDILEAVPEYRPIYDWTLAFLDSDEAIEVPIPIGDAVFNLLQDERYERGLLRRTSQAAYDTGEPVWEAVVDLDALSEAEGRPWVFQKLVCLPPVYRRCLLYLSAGGSDAAVVREFDLDERRFVEDGFRLEEAKTWTVWVDEDAILVASDFGEGSLKTSTLPRTVRLLKRGQPISEAEEIFGVSADEIVALPRAAWTTDRKYWLLSRARTFFSVEHQVWDGEDTHDLPIPADVQILAIHGNDLLLKPQSDWRAGGRTHAAGGLLAVPMADAIAGRIAPESIYAPSPASALSWVQSAGEGLYLSTLDNVRGRLFEARRTEAGWATTELPLPGTGSVANPLSCRCPFEELNSPQRALYFRYEGFLTPDALFTVGGDNRPRLVQQMEPMFEASGLETRQYRARSRDGTEIPYFIVIPKDLDPDGTAPTYLTAYGGFGVSYTPSYSGIRGNAWLGRGGVFVLASIRGGGEYGPAWHEAAVGPNHYRNFEDFIAVAEDLIARRITSPEQLGIVGGSQGGLLVGGSSMLRPELFGAVVSAVPLLDMKRYNKLLNGASWVSEYGNPDVPEDWAYMKAWSPYQLVSEDADYGEPFFWTTTRDDRVHPAHARKMVARMIDQGHPVLYFENTEGGHGAGSTNAQSARTTALQYAYLWRRLR
jgi:prolyl oligopeptidase